MIMDEEDHFSRLNQNYRLKWGNLMKILKTCMTPAYEPYEHERLQFKIIEDLIMMTLPAPDENYYKYYHLMYPDDGDLELSWQINDNTIEVKEMTQEMVNRLHYDYENGDTHYTTAIIIGDSIIFIDKDGNETLCRTKYKIEDVS